MSDVMGTVGAAYIPPEGAMQFEITNPRGGRNAGTLAVVVKGHEPPKTVWVMGKERNRGTCGCPIVHLMLIDSLPPPLRRLAIKSNAETGGHFIICDCSGKIIE